MLKSWHCKRAWKNLKRSCQQPSIKLVRNWNRSPIPVPCPQKSSFGSLIGSPPRMPWLHRRTGFQVTRVDPTPRIWKWEWGSWADSVTSRVRLNPVPSSRQCTIVIRELEAQGITIFPMLLHRRTWLLGAMSILHISRPLLELILLQGIMKKWISWARILPLPAHPTRSSRCVAYNDDFYKFCKK